MTDATKAYFAATEDGGFDHQRDAYEQGYADGAAAERERIIADVATRHYPIMRRPGWGRTCAYDNHRWPCADADLLDGAQ